MSKATARIMAMGCWVLATTDKKTAINYMNLPLDDDEYYILATRSFDTPDGVKKLVQLAEAKGLEVANYWDGRAWL